ncbi:hypothetical protein T492DRAFT_986535 [Pavlovales sp. CCMP2436]|nr:hypothetical protein T492DRAFT_986535 [Pavlovales sp. CCMP2436]
MAKVANDDALADVLLKREQKQYWGNPFGVSSVTFVDGDIDAAYAAARVRLSAVLRVNPWLCGQLDKQRRLVRPAAVSALEIDKVLSRQAVPTATRATPYEELVTALGPLSVQGGKALVASKGRVCRLVFVEPSAPGGEFAIVFSVSHIVADGMPCFNMMCVCVRVCVCVCVCV